MHQRRLAVVSLAAVTLCTAVCGGCSSSTKTTGEASSSTSTCYDVCATAWPPALTASAPTTVNGADRAKPSITTARTDGKTQIVYNGHPLYYFEGDQAKGDTNGEEPSAFGAKWYVVNPAGNKVEGD
ncbi:COG4315 family predicted lipoprotein [Streptomyces vietnamensis]|uniref:COG4315 family predicted lipoprotein n=1 Tax=Streptomyces vietnamensis TaxID=362257 RepID=UPI0006973110|nr:hypothetical protein [Streptomyces vietnamensis]